MSGRGIGPSDKQETMRQPCEFRLWYARKLRPEMRGVLDEPLDPQSGRGDGGHDLPERPLVLPRPRRRWTRWREALDRTRREVVVGLRLRVEVTPRGAKLHCLGPWVPDPVERVAFVHYEPTIPGE